MVNITLKPVPKAERRKAGSKKIRSVLDTGAGILSYSRSTPKELQEMYERSRRIWAMGHPPKTFEEWLLASEDEQMGLLPCDTGIEQEAAQ
jgi:hypothetical protein